MGSYAWPGSLLDRPRNLLSVLGSFWAKTFTEVDQVESYLASRAQAELQTELDAMDALASMSRFTVPLFHTDHWRLLLLRKSQRNNAETSLIRFDEGHTFDSGYVFDVPPQLATHAYPSVKNLTFLPAIMNRISDPSLVLVHGTDFLLDEERNAILLREDPFENPLWATRPVYEDGVIVDYEAALWMFHGQYEWSTLYNQFGYALGLKLKSSEGYRELIDAVTTMLMEGPSGRKLEQALSAMTGIPLVKELQETVELVTEDARGLLLATDRHIYRFATGVTPLVTVGQIVHAGDPLTDAMQIHELHRGEVPAGLMGLALGRGFLAHGFYGELVFKNQDAPLVVDSAHPSGFTHLRFDLGGHPLDVDAFFDEMHQRGIADYAAVHHDGRRHGTLAHLLDRRTNPGGEPLASDLPATINPLQFLIQNVLRNNAYLVQLKSAGMGSDALGLYNSRHLQRLLPPHTAMITLIEMTMPEERIAESAVQEGLEFGAALEPYTEVVPHDSVVEGPLTFQPVPGTYR